MVYYYYLLVLCRLCGCGNRWMAMYIRKVRKRRSADLVKQTEKVSKVLRHASITLRGSRMIDRSCAFFCFVDFVEVLFPNKAAVNVFSKTNQRHLDQMQENPSHRTICTFPGHFQTPPKTRNQLQTTVHLFQKISNHLINMEIRTTNRLYHR